MDHEENARLTNWFVARAKYTGRGRAEFLTPRGAVKGPTTVRFDEFGQETVTLQVEHVESDEPLTFGLMQLLARGRRQGHRDEVGFSATHYANAERFFPGTSVGNIESTSAVQ